MNLPIVLDCSATSAGGPLDHYWSRVVGAERPAAALRSDWIAHLKLAHDRLGVEYARFCGVFGEDMFVYRERDGRVDPSFQYLDAAFDALLGVGVKPFICLSFMPPELASTKQRVMWWGAWSSPPNDVGKWVDLVGATVRHWIERYGAAEVRSWYFEVWNEPNLAGFWDGTRTEYFEFYAATARAVKAVDAALRVGGPATSNFVPDERFGGEREELSGQRSSQDLAELNSWDWRPVWLAEFLDYCASHGLPVDFVSVHPYPTDWAYDTHASGAFQSREVGAIGKDLLRLREIVAVSSFPDAELQLSEWSSSAGCWDHTHDYPQAATYIVKSYLENLGLVGSLAYWTFTDIFEQGGAGDPVLHGGFGMITRWGNPKPTFYAMEMLNLLGDQLLAQTTGVVVSRDSASGKITAVVYHYPDEEPRTVRPSLEAPGSPCPPPLDNFGFGRVIADQTLATGTDRGLQLRICDLPPGAQFAITSIDAKAGNLAAAFQAAGCPFNPSPAMVTALTDASRPRTELAHADNHGTLTLNRPLPPWTVLAVTQL